MKSYKRMVLSDKETTRELYDAIKAGGWDTVVDVVEEGNMNPVTSNAVAKALSQYVTKTGKIVVTVKDYTTGSLLEGISVKVGNNTKVTDSTGQCTFEDYKYGSYMVKIFATGYDPFYDGVYLDAESYSYTAELIPEEAEYGTVNVSVIDKTTSQGINNATVKLNNTTQTTDDLGKCTFTQVPYGSYIIQAKHDLYNDAFDTFTLKESTYDSTVEMVTKSETKTGTVNLVVYDSETGLALPLVKVSIGSQTIFTDDSGKGTISNITYGSYLVTASLNGYGSFESTVMIESETLDYSIRLSKVTGTINVTVQDSTTGTALSDATVTIGDTTETTGTDGKCSFTDLTYDTYTIKVSHADYNNYEGSIVLQSSEVNYIARLSQSTKKGSVNIYVQDQKTQSSLSNVSVTINGTTQETDTDGKCTFTDLIYSSYAVKAILEGYDDYSGTVTVDADAVDFNISMTPTVQVGDINVTVTDENTSSPVESATVIIGESIQQTDANGQCSFLDMDYGTYSVDITHDNYVAFKDTITLSVEDLEYSAKLTPVEQKGTINITITDKNTSSPVESATVQVGTNIKYTDSDGKCSFTDLTYDTYSVGVLHNDYEPYTGSVTLESSSVDYTIELTPLTKTGDINCTVVNSESSVGIQYATVEIGGNSQTTDADGKCSFTSLEYGNYDVKITHEDYNDYTDTITLDSATLEYTAKLTASIKKGNAIITVLNSSTSEAVAGATVTISDYIETTDSDGKATFTDLMYSTYALIVKCENYDDYDGSITVDASEVTATVNLDPTQKTSVRITGIIVDENNKGLEDVTVKVDNTYSDNTNSDGEYIIDFDETNADTYSITYEKSYFNTGTVSIEKEAGKTLYTVPTQTMTISEYVEQSSISGTVKALAYQSTTYEVASGVSFKLQHATDSTEYSAVSGSDGSFSLSNIKCGFYNIIVSGNKEYSDETLSKAFFLRPTESQTDYELIVTCTYHDYALSVVHQDGTTANNYNISICETGQTEVLATGTTDDKGVFNFRITNEDINLNAIVTYPDSTTFETTIGSSTGTSSTITIPDETKYGTINVTASDKDTSIPIESATVEINGETQTTDADGKCSFTNLEYGDYPVKITHEDYNDYTDSITVASESVEYTAQLTAVIKTGTINVTVLDNITSAAIGDASVKINDVVKTTDSDGKCSFTDLTYGNYAVEITHTDYNDYTDTITLASATLEYTAKLTEIVKTGTINVTVVDNTTSTAINNATVELGGNSQTTDTDGKCSFTDLEYNTYTIKISHEDYNEYTDTITLDNESIDYTAQLTAVTKTGTINITAIDNTTSVAIANATVEVGGNSQATDTDGKCTFKDLEYGDYTVKITHEDYNDYTDSITVASESIDYTAKLTAIIKTGTINVTVTDNTTSTGIANANVKINNTTKTTDTDGKCSFTDLEYNTYSVSVTHEGYESYAGSITLNDSVVESKIELTPSTKTGAVNFTVIDSETSAAVKYAIINIGDITEVADADGKCTVSDLAYGDYNVKISSDNYEDYTDTITVASASLDYTAKLVATVKTGTINITVLDKKTSSPVSSAMVDINYATLITDSLGKCSLSNVEYGDYPVKITHSSYADYTDTITLASATMDYTAELSTATTHNIQVDVWYENESTAPNRKIEIHEEGKTDIIASGVTNKNGEFNFSIDDSPVIDLYATVYLYDGSAVERELGVSTITGVKVYIPSSGRSTLTVKAIDIDTSDPVVGASVTVDDITETTGDTGECTYELYYDTYNLTIESEGYKTYEDKVSVTSESVEYTAPLSPLIERGNATITVLNSTTGEAVSGATVTIGDYTETTGTDGKATLKYITYGTYALKVVCTDYNDYEDSITVDAPEVAMTVNLKPEQKTSIRVTGTIVDEDNKGLENVTVKIDDTYSGVTDSDGAYIIDFDENNANAYILTYTKSYFSDGTVSIEKEAGKTLYNVPTQIMKISDYSVHGEISNALVQNLIYQSTTEYEPSAGLNFILQHADSSTGVEYTLTTDENGLFSFSVWSGHYNFIVEGDSDYNPETKNNAFFIRPTETLENLKLEITRISHDFNLTVKYEDGTIANGNKVEVYTKDSSDLIAEGTTNESGIFLFNVSNETEEALTAKVYLINGSIVESDIGDSSGTSAEITLPNEKRATLNITVNYNSGSYVYYSDIEIDGVTGRTDADHKCTLEGIRYGTHTITIKTQYYETYTDTITINSESQDYTATLTRGKCNLTVYVVDSFMKTALDKATVTVGGTSKKTGTDGKVVFENLDQDSRKVNVSCTDYTTDYMIVVADQPETEATIPLVHNPTKITFTIISRETSEAIQGATLEMNGTTATTGTNGKCSFENLYYGVYPLKITKDGYDDYEEDVTLSMKNTQRTITIHLHRAVLNITAINTVSGEVATGVTVQLGSEIKTTDNMGKCSFEDLLYDTYSILAISTYYKGYSGNVTVNDSVVDYTLNLTGSAGDVNFVVYQPDSMSRVEGAKVTINGDTKTTNETGECTLKEVAYGLQTVTAYYKDYKDYEGTINVQKQSMDANIFFKEGIGTLAVTVVDDTNKRPLKDANVTFEGTTKTTDVNGECSFENITYGDYSIKVTHANYEDTTEDLTVHGDPDKHTIGLKSVIERGTLKIYVINENYGAIEGATVKVGDWTETTDSTGYAAFENLLYSTYTVEVSYSMYVTQTESITLAESSLTRAFKLERAMCSVLRVTVRDEVSGSFINGATVQVGDYTGTTTSGAVTFNNILQGVYDIKVTATGYYDYEDKLEVYVEELWTDAYLLTSSDHKDLTILCLDSESGDPIPNVNLSIESTEGVTGEDGKYTFVRFQIGVFTLKMTCTGYKDSTAYINHMKEETMEMRLNKEDSE